MRCKYCGKEIIASVYRKGKFNHTLSGGAFCRTESGGSVLRSRTYATPGYFLDYLDQIEQHEDVEMHSK